MNPPRPPNTTGLIRRTARWEDGLDQQAWLPQPPAGGAAPFDPASGFPWNLDDGEAFVQLQLWPDVTTDTGYAWGPPLNAVADQSWNQDEGERFVVDQFRPDDTQVIRGATPPELRAFAADGGEVQQQPTEDPSVQSWAVGPPPNVVQLSAWPGLETEPQAAAVEDPTGQSYSIQPPAAAGFDPAAGFPWGSDRAEPFVVDQNVPDPDMAVEFGVQLFDPAGFPFNQPDEAALQATEDPSVQPWPVQVFTAPFTPPPFPFNVDDSERFYQQQLTDDNVGYALGLVPANAVAAQVFNTPQEVVTEPGNDPTVQAWAVPDPLIFVPPFNAALVPHNQDQSELFFDARWTFLAAWANEQFDIGAVEVYPIPANPAAPSDTLSPDPWFRRLQPPPGYPEIEAWSLYTSLVARYGLAEGRNVYARMLAERKGPFAAGAKYDPERHQPTPAIPHIEIPKARRN